MSLYEQTLPQSQMVGHYRVIETPLMHDDYDYDDQQVYLPPHQGPQVADPIQQRMVVILGAVGVLILLFALLALPKLRGERDATAVTTTNPQAEPETAVAAEPLVEGNISPVFAREVKHWEPQILKWASMYNLDPDIIATIMQIESCGDPQAVSSAGATGLFQVMPFHFDPGEDMFNPDTNAMRGMRYYNMGLQTHQGDVFLSFAGYNGGHGTVPKGWDNWPNEMQRYHYWAKGIYEDAKSGSDTSPRLNEWFAAGGSGLCLQAANRLGIQ